MKYSTKVMELVKQLLNSAFFRDTNKSNKRKQILVICENFNELAFNQDANKQYPLYVALGRWLTRKKYYGKIMISNLKEFMEVKLALPLIFNDLCLSLTYKLDEWKLPEKEQEPPESETPPYEQ